MVLGLGTKKHFLIGRVGKQIYSPLYIVSSSYEDFSLPLESKQAPGESLRSYVQRFNEENMQIPDQNEQVTIAAFTNWLTA